MISRCFGHKPSIVDDEAFMTKYYDCTSVPKESELDPEEFKTCLESWYVLKKQLINRANYRMFNGVKMRKNGDWYAYYKDSIEGL